MRIRFRGNGLGYELRVRCLTDMIDAEGAGSAQILVYSFILGFL